MKTKLYIVSYVSFDGYDDNLYTEVKTFTDRDKAEAFYRQSVDTARADARREEDGYDEDDWTPISENESDGEYNVSRDNDERYFTRVELTEQEIDIPYDTDRRKYGMTLKEIRDEIAAFTGDKKSEAMRKARIFAHHVSLHHVSSIGNLRFGICKHEDGTEYENRDWLEIRWTDLDGDSDTFSIIE